ncbi:tetratricopeptide repeat protein [Phaeobacter porticola]|uniref:Putative adenylate cyclase n=1 Tax=Phaeobacter porticola TaxID=1844006 RepID=A0A1L3I4T5_9RHOB|nr:adenylate cyclase [Phaeobacter porticola]APG47087.1 putative adenylate cyclase [Phaeobacter porticola]
MQEPIQKTLPKISTRLAAFAFADVADYTRHMEISTTDTVRRWGHLRDAVLLDEMLAFNGVRRSDAGDALLLEFTSASDAVQWAMSVQNRLGQQDIDTNPMQIRIGVNIDDVIDDDGTVQSDGVVVASRIHQLADPGTVVVTKMVRDIVRGKLPLRFHDLGAPLLKNIDRPVQIFQVSQSAGEILPLRPHADWKTRPTLAVLPFEDRGAKAEERYFGDGITEEIISGVSRSRAMFVMARTSTLKFRGSHENPADIGRSLGVSYILTGAVDRYRNQIRIFAELMDVLRNRAIWAQTYRGDLQDLFAFQDEIASGILAMLEPKVLSTEAEHISARSTDSLDAYKCVLRALAQLYQLDDDSYGEAIALLQRAVALDPNYPQAHAYLAWCMNFFLAEGHSQNPRDDILSMINLSRRAVELDPDDALTLSVRAHVLSLHENSPEDALELFDDALAHNINLPLAWGLSAITYAYLGDGAEARERLLNVWRLAPYDPLNFFFLTAAGLAEFVDGNLDEACRFLKNARRNKPRFMAALRLLAACSALRGRTGEAQQVAQEILQLDPGFSVSKFAIWYPLKSKEALDRLTDGLIRAGLPA